MIFKRKIYNQLLDWKNKDNGSTAILIKGARRVGKSTIAEEFARNEYSHIYRLTLQNALQKYVVYSMMSLT